MTAPPEDYGVGYGRPPLQSRWKKGESGNPHKKPRRQEAMLEIIDRLLLSLVTVTSNGETKRVTALEAIVSQLQLKEMSGNVRASRILLEYRELVHQHAEKKLNLVFINNHDAGTNVTSEDGNGY